MPRFGRATLRFGCVVLQFGHAMPWLERAMPWLGRATPRSGVATPGLGPALPHRGLSRWVQVLLERAGMRDALQQPRTALLPLVPQGSSPLPSRRVSHRCRHVQPATWASCVSEGSRERAGGCDKAPACGGVSTALLRRPSSCRSRFHFLPVPACAAQLHAVQQLPRSILFRDERCFRSGRKL